MFARLRLLQASARNCRAFSSSCRVRTRSDLYSADRYSAYEPGEAGNLSLDAFTGPTYFDWDLSASRDFHLTERFKLTFRTEAFNVLNHPVFFVSDQPVSSGTITTSINSTQFGQSLSTVSQARILQMSLRLKF
jgi:hypothetical protein